MRIISFASNIGPAAAVPAGPAPAPLLEHFVITHVLSYAFLFVATVPFWRLRYLEHSFLGLSHCALMLKTMIRKWAMWWRLSEVEWVSQECHRDELPPKQANKHEHWAPKSHSGVTLHLGGVWAYLKNLGIPPWQMQTSALAEHVLAYHHDIVWNEAEILDSNSHLNKPRMCLKGMAYLFGPAPPYQCLWTESLVCYLKCITYWSSPQLHLTLLFDLTFP